MTQANEQLAEAIAELLNMQKHHVTDLFDDVLRSGMDHLAHCCHVALCDEYGQGFAKKHPNTHECWNVFYGNRDLESLDPFGGGVTLEAAIFNAVLDHSKGVA